MRCAVCAPQVGRVVDASPSKSALRALLSDVLGRQRSPSLGAGPALDALLADGAHLPARLPADLARAPHSAKDTDPLTALEAQAAHAARLAAHRAAELGQLHVALRRAGSAQGEQDALAAMDASIEAALGKVAAKRRGHEEERARVTARRGALAQDKQTKLTE